MSENWPRKRWPERSSEERNHLLLSNFGKAAYEKHICEIIVKSENWPRRKCHLKFFFFFFFFFFFVGGGKGWGWGRVIFSSSVNLVQWSEPVLAA